MLRAFLLRDREAERGKAVQEAGAARVMPGLADEGDMGRTRPRRPRLAHGVVAVRKSEAGEPVEIADSRREKYAGVMPIVEEDDPVERLGRDIMEHADEGRRQVVRVGHKEDLWAFEGSKVSRDVSPA